MCNEPLGTLPTGDHPILRSGRHFGTKQASSSALGNAYGQECVFLRGFDLSILQHVPKINHASNGAPPNLPAPPGYKLMPRLPIFWKWTLAHVGIFELYFAVPPQQSELPATAYFQSLSTTAADSFASGSYIPLATCFCSPAKMAPPTTPVKVTTFPLTARHLVPTALCATVMVLSARRSFIQPGSPLHDYVLLAAGWTNPGTLATTQDFVFRALWWIHAAEAVVFAATKLPRHGVPFMSGLWWKWMGAMFFGGVGTWKHWAKTVQAQGKGKTV